MPSLVLPVRPGTSPTRWEYLCTGQESLGEAGAQGWELVSVTPLAATTTGSMSGYGTSFVGWYCFKRALPPPAP